MKCNRTSGQMDVPGSEQTPGAQSGQCCQLPLQYMHSGDRIKGQTLRTPNISSITDSDTTYMIAVRNVGKKHLPDSI